MRFLVEVKEPGAPTVYGSYSEVDGLVMAFVPQRETVAKLCARLAANWKPDSTTRGHSGPNGLSVVITKKKERAK